ncbi:hypothetical protein [Nitrosovibrio tenuis]|uniref:Uncharacterized protein n=1 Tax=Nitrosovibrio tenuis TaxID=1233 RepID=A0A1H7GSR1_9PROT|nr:hypothetical protein [Nitrosovibrio tenuis]SEK41059.1 hypothetical protein SAMN05216387_101371 [Nitrosovibrio tenuis]
MSNSLEDERKAILERMSASRRNFRHMFDHEEDHDHEPVYDAHTFPRSHTFRFLTKHPYYATLSALAAVAIIPRGLLKKAVKGGATVTAGILGSGTKTSMIRYVLPPTIRLLRSYKRRGR